MIKKAILCCFLVTIFICVAGCGIRKVGKFRAVACDYETHKVGYIDEFGTWVIEPRYEEAESFLAGRAIVKMQGKQIVIDKDGKEEKNPHFAKGKLVRDEEGNIYICNKGSSADKKWNFQNIYNEHGDLILENVLFLGFKNGFIVATKHKTHFAEEYGLYSKSGKDVVTIDNLDKGEFGKIDSISTYSKNLIRVRSSKRGSVFMDSKGNELLKCKNYAGWSSDNISKGIALVHGFGYYKHLNGYIERYTSAEKCYIVDEKGELIKDVSGCTQDEIKENLFIARKGKYFLKQAGNDVAEIYDSNMALVGKYKRHDPQEFVSEFTNDFAFVGYPANFQRNLFFYGVIDKTGKLLFKNKSVELLSINENGLIRGRIDDSSPIKWDKNGNRKKVENFFGLDGKKKFDKDYFYVRDYVKVE